MIEITKEQAEAIEFLTKESALKVSKEALLEFQETQ